MCCYLYAKFVWKSKDGKHFILLNECRACVCDRSSEGLSGVCFPWNQPYTYHIIVLYLPNLERSLKIKYLAKGTSNGAWENFFSLRRCYLLEGRSIIWANFRWKWHHLLWLWAVSWITLWGGTTFIKTTGHFIGETLVDCAKRLVILSCMLFICW